MPDARKWNKEQRAALIEVLNEFVQKFEKESDNLDVEEACGVGYCTVSMNNFVQELKAIKG